MCSEPRGAFRAAEKGRSRSIGALQGLNEESLAKDVPQGLKPTQFIGFIRHG